MLLVDETMLILGVGFIVFMIGLASFGIQMAIRRSAKERAKREGERGRSQAARIAAERSSRAEALEEAIRREPDLADASSPNELARLDEAVQAIQKERQLKRELESVRAAERTKRAQEQKARADREKAEIHRQARAAEEKRLSDKYASKPLRRFVALHPGQSAAVGLGLVSVSAAVGWFMVVPWAVEFLEQQQIQAAREDAIASCDPMNRAVNRYRSEPEVVAAWAQCPDPSVRVTVAQLTAASPETLEVLARDPSSEVRMAVAQRPSGLTNALILLLARDDDRRVRYALLESQKSQETAALFLEDLDPVIASLAQSFLEPDSGGKSALCSDPIAGQQWVGEEESADVDEPLRPLEVLFRPDCVLEIAGRAGFVRTTWKQDSDFVTFQIGTRTFDGKLQGTQMEGTWSDRRDEVGGRSFLDGHTREGKEGRFSLSLVG